MMHLAGCSALGVEPLPPASIDWNRLFAYAKEQGVPVMIAQVLLGAKSIDLPDKVRDYCDFLYYQFVAKEGYRRELVSDLLGVFENAHISVAVLKGYAVASVYAQPDCRISGDVDLLVSPKDEKAAIKLLEKQGFEVMQRAVASHHSEAHHEQIGVVELHNALYDSAAENLWFSGESTFAKLEENYITVDGMPSLGYTDHLIFLTLHMMKHFIGGGLSLRMLLDVGLYYFVNLGSIDTDRYWTILDKLRFTKAIRVFFSILGKYCGLSFDLVDDELMEAVLLDMERGGAFSVKDKSLGIVSAWEYSKSSVPSAEYDKIKAEKMRTYRLRRFFPTYRTLIAEYPVLKKCPLLYPFVWSWRLAAHTIKKLFGRKPSSLATAPVSNIRGELFSALGLGND